MLNKWNYNLYLFQSVYSLPATGGILLAYIIPGYLLTGIHYPKLPDLNSFYQYIGTGSMDTNKFNAFPLQNLQYI